MPALASFMYRDGKRAEQLPLSARDSACMLRRMRRWRRFSKLLDVRVKLTASTSAVPVS
ncbi:hypothetical protein ILFOPFJJ_05843 [Ensifer psoraleae]|nr:hypothetical protein [Sinorhizobium psoraleae]